MNGRTALLVVDPQIDFCDPQGALYVPGAERDMERLARFIRREGQRLDQVHVTLDSHHAIHIAHPVFWRDTEGSEPPPLTTITLADVERNRWTTAREWMRPRARDYLRALEAGGRYRLTIWNPHCLIGSRNHAVDPGLFAALGEWEAAREDGFASVDYVTKGANIWTEHYSALRAEVPDPADPATQLNRLFIDRLARADTVLVAGEALTHCVANTVRDIAEDFGARQVSKLVLLEDATSSIPGFEEHAASFLRDMRRLGMRVSTTTDPALFDG